MIYPDKADGTPYTAHEVALMQAAADLMADEYPEDRRDRAVQDAYDLNGGEQTAEELAAAARRWLKQP